LRQYFNAFELFAHEEYSESGSLPNFIRDSQAEWEGVEDDTSVFETNALTGCPDEEGFLMTEDYEWKFNKCFFWSSRRFSHLEDQVRRSGGTLHLVGFGVFHGDIGVDFHCVLDMSVSCGRFLHGMVSL
jgi:hypothetical protein